MFLWFLQLFGSLFTRIVEFFTAYVGKKLALRAGLAVMFGGISTAFLLGIKALILGMSLVIPPELMISWGWFMPDNFSTCVSLILSAEVIAWVYRQKIAFFRAMNGLMGIS